MRTSISPGELIHPAGTQMRLGGIFLGIITTFPLLAQQAALESAISADSPPTVIAATPTAELREPIEVANLPRPRESDNRETLEAELKDGLRGLESQAKILRSVVKLVRPSAVHILAEKTPDEPVPEGSFIEEAGAGVIVELHQRYFVLTNCHVVRGANPEQIRLRLASGRNLRPMSVLIDPESDVALLEVTAKDLTPAKLGDSSQAEIGDYVLAIGSPFGLSHTVTYGIISARSRSDLALGNENVRIQDFIQTDAAINPGNSGGPLFNLRAELIGINTAIASDTGVNSGIGFAVPINIAKKVAEQLVTSGRVKRGLLGVELDAKFDGDAAVAMGLPGAAGSRVTRVRPGGAADVGGIQVGDVIWTFDRELVQRDQHLVNLVALAPVDQQIPIVVFRQGKPLRRDVTLHAK